VSWIRLLPLEELPAGTARAVTAGLDDLLVCRTDADHVYVVEDVCSNDDAPLGDQALDGAVVTCPRHGARFDVTSGEVLKAPAPVGIDTFATRLSPDGWIEVDLEA